MLEVDALQERKLVASRLVGVAFELDSLLFIPAHDQGNARFAA